eukprot:8520577-Heterocapsa_arctica.AAC.1
MVVGIDGVVRLVDDLKNLVLPGRLCGSAIVAFGVVSLGQGVVLAVVVRVPDRAQSSTPPPRQARGVVGVGAFQRRLV